MWGSVGKEQKENQVNLEHCYDSHLGKGGVPEGKEMNIGQISLRSRVN